MDMGFVVHVHVFNVHRGNIAFRDHLKAGHDTSQSSLCINNLSLSLPLSPSLSWKNF